MTKKKRAQKAAQEQYARTERDEQLENEYFEQQFQQQQQQQPPPIPPMEKLQISYSTSMHIFHIWLIYFFVSTIVLCPLDQCWTVQTWIHFTWALQAFFYSVSYLGQWFPEIERHLMLSMLFPLHGALWLSVCCISWSLTPNALAARKDLYIPFARTNGTIWSMLVPLTLFYIFIFAKRFVLSLMFNDWVRTLDPKKSWSWMSGYSYQLFGAAMLPLLFHVLFSPAVAAYDRTDWYWRGGVWQPFVALFFSLIFNLVLSFYIFLLSFSYITPTIWLRFYREGVVLYDSLSEPKHVIIGVVH